MAAAARAARRISNVAATATTAAGGAPTAFRGRGRGRGGATAVGRGRGGRGKHLLFLLFSTALKTCLCEHQRIVSFGTACTRAVCKRLWSCRLSCLLCDSLRMHTCMMYKSCTCAAVKHAYCEHSGQGSYNAQKCTCTGSSYSDDACVLHTTD
jgi:hypothetical protein